PTSTFNYIFKNSRYDLILFRLINIFQKIKFRFILSVNHFTTLFLELITFYSNVPQLLLCLTITLLIKLFMLCSISESNLFFLIIDITFHILRNLFNFEQLINNGVHPYPSLQLETTENWLKITLPSL